ARSMPAVTPAEVARSPSLMKIGSGSTVTSGYWAARSAQRSQWVVTVRPVSSPASASRNAPVQTDASRSAFGALRRSQPTRSGARRRAPGSGTPRPGGGPAGAAARPAGDDHQAGAVPARGEVGVGHQAESARG